MRIFSPPSSSSLSLFTASSITSLPPNKHPQKYTNKPFKALCNRKYATMDAVLRQSKSMCPFLKKTSPATLRSLSTSTRHASPCGGSMSNLQTIARRCPIMGKALIVQSAKAGKVGFGGGVAGLGAVRSISGKVNSGKARIHTSRPKEARAVEDTLFGREKGISFPLLPLLRF